MEKKENKTMKKGLTIAALALLLGIVGYTGGNTFAKYVTEATPVSESATVAQWGYTLSAEATNLFGNKYVGTTLATVKDDAGSGIVVAGNTADKQVVAPGTTGSMEVKILGQAEVLSQLRVNASITDIFLDTDENAENGRYSPIVWSVKNGSTSVKEKVSAKELVAYLNGLSNIFEPNSPALEYNLTITWEWALENSKSNIDGVSVNEADTILGKIAEKASNAGAYKYNTNMSVSLTMSVEQIQQ